MSNCNSRPSKETYSEQVNSCSIQNNEHSKIRHVIGMMSGKGGVGKSGIGVLIAKEMARRGFRVGIMDADITGPGISRLMGLECAQTFGTNDTIGPVVDKDDIKVMSLNSLMGNENQPVVWRGSIVANAVKQFWTDVVWEELDCLFIDMPPGTGDAALTVLQGLPVDEAVMVSISQSMVSMVISKAINIYKQVKIEVLGITKSMSYIACPGCGKRIRILQHCNVEDSVKESEVPLWAKLPMMSSTSRIYRDNDFDMEIAQQMYIWVLPMADQLIEKMGK